MRTLLGLLAIGACGRVPEKMPRVRTALPALVSPIAVHDVEGIVKELDTYQEKEMRQPDRGVLATMVEGGIATRLMVINRALPHLGSNARVKKITVDAWIDGQFQCTTQEIALAWSWDGTQNARLRVPVRVFRHKGNTWPHLVVTIGRTGAPLPETRIDRTALTANHVYETAWLDLRPSDFDKNGNVSFRFAQKEPIPEKNVWTQSLIPIDTSAYGKNSDAMTVRLHFLSRLPSTPVAMAVDPAQQFKITDRIAQNVFYEQEPTDEKFVPDPVACADVPFSREGYGVTYTFQNGNEKVIQPFVLAFSQWDNPLDINALVHVLTSQSDTSILAPHTL